MNQLNVLDPKQYLAAELKRRCQENPRYSMRAFAKTLKITQAGLSMILSGKRNISRKAGQRMAEILGLNPSMRNAFVNGCTQIHSMNFIQENELVHDLALDQFELISEWYHYGILSLIETKDFKPSFSYIARRLGVSLIEIKTAVERLVRMGILDTKGKKWKQIGGPLGVDNNISTPATKKWQKRVLEKAIESSENDPFELRDMTCMTLAIDPKFISLAVPEITKFRRHMMVFLEALGKPSEVYHLSVQLYPVSKPDADKK